MTLQSATFANRFERAHDLFTSTFGNFQEVSQSIAGLRVRTDQARKNAQTDNLRECHPRELHDIAQKITTQAQTLVANKLQLTQVINAVKKAADFAKRSPIDSYTIETIDALGISDGLGGRIDQAQKQLPAFRKQLVRDLAKLIKEEQTMQNEIKGLTSSLNSLQSYIENRGWFQGLISAAFKNSPIEAAQFEDALETHVPASLGRDQYTLPTHDEIDGYDSAVESDDESETEDEALVTKETIAPSTKKADIGYVAKVLREQRQLQKDMDRIMNPGGHATASASEPCDTEDDVQEIKEQVATKTPLRRSARIRSQSTGTRDSEARFQKDKQRAAEFLKQLEASNLVESDSDPEDDIPFSALYPAALQRRQIAEAEKAKKVARTTPSTKRSTRTRKAPIRFGFEVSKKIPYAEVQKELDAISAQYDKIVPSVSSEESDPEDDIPFSALYPAALQRRQIAKQEAAEAKKAPKTKKVKKAVKPTTPPPRRSTRVRKAPNRLGFEVSETSAYKKPMEMLKVIVSEKETEEVQEASAKTRRSTRVKATKRAPKEKAPTAPRRRSTRRAAPVIEEEVTPVVVAETPAVTVPLRRSTRTRTATKFYGFS
ncbi:hypothetical protein COB11_06970 [Candidatus Aerophobetes bacterium]|uniref:Uncharacterized protein n=1 Tax=Aerophobetes bacterium TaxID=2030807 RepID=A0A2A4YD56_UNCAE|nr:MAG: hypothetical protein COB11_06970 [Candidatus Aerophobetes bacterium]